MSGTPEPVHLEIEDRVALIRIDRPEKLNALSRHMIDRLGQCAADIDRNRRVRAVILYSGSPRAFGVGADIHDWASLAPLEMWRDWVRTGHRVIRALEELLQPVIAVTNGYTYGGSLELALAADIRIGEEQSSYAFPEASVGTLPGWMGSEKALKLIGPSRLKRLIFTAEPISAEQALNIGLIDEVAPEGHGLARAKRIAARICESSPVSVSLAKQVINAIADGRSVTALESIAGGLAASSEDGGEGKASFREKRKARFTGS